MEIVQEQATCLVDTLPKPPDIKLTNKGALRRERNRCRRDLFHLCREYLGYEDLDDELHGGMCRFLQGPKKRKLLVGFRGGFKTSCGTVGGTYQDLLNHPIPRILVAGNIEENAEMIVQEIRTHAEENERIRWLLGVGDAHGDGIIPRKRYGSKWSSKALLFNRDGINKQPSVMAAGCDSQLAGTHWSSIYGDDVVAAARKDAKDQAVFIIPQEEIDKAIGFHSLAVGGISLKVADPKRKTKITYILNFWGPQDFANWMIDNNLKSKDNPKGFEYMLFAARNSDGSPAWPDVLNEEELAQLRRDYGEYMYWTQIECKPFDPMSQGFKPEHNVFMEDDVDYNGFWPKGHEEMNLYCMMDLADSKNPGTCFTTFVVFLVDSKNHIWVMEAVRKRMDTNGKLELITEMYRRYSFPVLYVEENLHHDTLEYVLRGFKEKTGYPFRVRTNKHKNRNKDSRILKLQPHHQARAIHLKRKQKDLIGELRDWPSGRWKDLVDTLAYAMDIIRKPPWRMEIEQEIYDPRVIRYKDVRKAIVEKNKQGRRRKRFSYASAAMN